MSEEKRIAPLFTWRSAICDSDLAATTRHVALTLSLYMNERGGSAFPGAERMARDTALTERSVRDHLNLLARKGWLTRVSAGGGRGKAAVWQARIPERASGNSGDEKGEADDAKPGTTFPPTHHEDTTTSSNSASPRAEPFASEFEHWWSTYPRKQKRQAALKAFQARRRESVDLARLTAARDFYAVAMVGVELRFVMHGATFLAPKGPWSEWEEGPPEPGVGGARPRRPRPDQPRSGAERDDHSRARAASLGAEAV